MPWSVTSVMDQRCRFVIEALSGLEPLSRVCARYGVSRDTGYKWLGRYRAGGFSGLADGSRARRTQSAALAPDIAALLLGLRQERPSWGPKKLRSLLGSRHPGLVLPAASTIGDLLARHGLVVPRPVRQRGLPQTRPFMSACAPHDLWCIDFKGWFRTQDGQRCDPLTVSDAVSRFLLVCQIVDPTTAGVWPACEQLFREHGQPRALRMDNGPPFGSKGAAGLTRLSVKWVKLGIVLEPITPGCPGQNGRHERMHRELKASTSRPPQATLAAQQRRFDWFRQDYNEVRPHEALGQQTPASVHRPNGRSYTGRLDDPWYDADHQVERVLGKGEIRCGDELLYISEALAGELVGVAELPTGDRVVRFANIDLGVIAAGSTKFRRFGAARPGLHRNGPTRETVSHEPGLKCKLCARSNRAEPLAFFPAPASSNGAQSGGVISRIGRVGGYGCGWRACVDTSAGWGLEARRLQGAHVSRTNCVWAREIGWCGGGRRFGAGFAAGVSRRPG